MPDPLRRVCDGDGELEQRGDDLVGSALGRDVDGLLELVDVALRRKVR
ncbi:MAG: hypothetical protein ACREA0_18795 [bacterium]